MNCKPNELAIVVSGSPAHNIGKIVRVTCLHPYAPSGCVCWMFEGNLLNKFGDTLWGVADDCLRPLRDNPGQDETLTWRDVPTGVPA